MGSSTELGLKEDTLTGRIVLAYSDTSSAGCIRQLKADAYVGSVVDVPSDGVIRNSTIRTDSGRTIVTFTVSMHAGTSEKELSWHGLIKKGWGELEVMWAIGQVGGDGACDAPIQFHSLARGLTALGFPAGRFECDSDDSETLDNLDSMLSTDLIVV